jgi:hypothetical protein
VRYLQSVYACIIRSIKKEEQVRKGKASVCSSEGAQYSKGA